MFGKKKEEEKKNQDQDKNKKDIEDLEELFVNETDQVNSANLSENDTDVTNKKESENIGNAENKTEKVKDKAEIKEEKKRKKREKKEQKKQEKQAKKESKENKEKQEKSPKNRKALKIAIIIIVILLMICIGIAIYLVVRPKFKDVTIELGTTEVTVDDFLTWDMYKFKASAVTDLSSLDLSKTQTLDVTLSFWGHEETVKLNIVDTTPPTVDFKDMTAYLDYEADASNFIELSDDYSDVTVEFVNEPEFDDYGTYDVDVVVRDSSGNETYGTCKLVISWLLSEVNIELGEDFSADDVVFDAERFADLVPEEEIEKVDTSKLGEYELHVEIEGKEYTCVVNVQDTTGPTLKLKDITIWTDETVSSYEKFIKSVKDASGDVTTECLTEYTFGTAGTQTVTIRATDKYGNTTEKSAKLIIKNDTTGPTFSGLSDKTVSKGSTIDYKKGVSATDDKDGKCSFTVDSSKVDVSKAGTYYATYTSTDSAGNTTTKKRKIIVNHNSSDTSAKLTDFYNKYCKGKDAVAITKVVRDKITYSSNWGGSDPIWYGLTNGSGNCYVHAKILQGLLQKAGYECRIIWTTDKTHYWNLVKYSGGWYHFDSTKSNYVHFTGPATDKQKHSEASFGSKRTWDASNPNWPASPTKVLSTATN